MSGLGRNKAIQSFTNGESWKKQVHLFPVLNYSFVSFALRMVEFHFFRMALHGCES